MRKETDILALFGTFLALGFLSACVHPHRAENMLQDRQESLTVSTEGQSFREGDLVKVMTEQCQTIGRTNGPSVDGKCTKEFLGYATIINTSQNGKALVNPTTFIKEVGPLTIEK